ncbi:MAG: hypothetical protein FJY29_01980 [Betaproteobacteria bacterium]|nr:hypothetical protein [Betaproteobacteria bacterium]
MVHQRLMLASVVGLIGGGFFACKPRSYNQAKTKELVSGEEGQATLCAMISPGVDGANPSSKSGLRVACPGQCNGVDYRNRKFYILNEETVAGYEYAITLNTGHELRNLFVIEPTTGLLSALKQISLENQSIQKSLQQYGFDAANVTNIGVPADGKLLLLPGTKASLSQAGLLDGGTLDCGGQPIEGSVGIEEFKSQNLDDVKKSAAAPK